MKVLFWELRERARTLAQRLNEKIPAQRRLLVFACGGVSLVLLIFVLAHLASGSGEKAGLARTPAVRQALIPSEELFLPEEPDFLPGVMLGREQRTVWTTGDAVPFWQDPLKNGEEQWRERVEAAVDELLERVP